LKYFEEPLRVPITARAGTVFVVKSSFSAFGAAASSLAFFSSASFFSAAESSATFLSASLASLFGVSGEPSGLSATIFSFATSTFSSSGDFFLPSPPSFLAGFFFSVF
jgi:hypothetical protein